MASKWPSLAIGRFDMTAIIPSITEFFKDRLRKSRNTTCDGLILRMHYSWTMIAMMGAFVTVYYGWWANKDADGTKIDQIICASHFSATEMESKRDYINVCLSYSYVEDKSRPNGRRYLLFYRWIDWTLLLLAALYYIPRKVARGCENQKVINLLESIDNEEKIGEGHYKKSIVRAQAQLMSARAEEKNLTEEDLTTARIRDEVTLANELIEKMGIRDDKQCSELKAGKVKELLADIGKVSKENVQEKLKNDEESANSDADKILNLAKAADYFTRKSHKALFWKYVLVHSVALVIDFVALEMLNFLLQGRFLSLGLYTYEWRDPDNFSDPISKTFPPFASCEISEEKQLVAKRTEKLGCHLTLMELYEKVFIFLWFWLIILTVCTIIYIIGIFIVFFTPFIRKYLFYVKHPDFTNGHGQEVKRHLNDVYRQCDYGDIFLLLQVRKFLTNIQMFELLMIIRNPESLNLLDNDSDTTEELQTPSCPSWNSGPGVIPKHLSNLDLPKYMMDNNSNKPTY